MAKDKYHELVKKALVKEGWTITDDPFYLETLKREIEVDLGAERLIGASKDKDKIAVEIKSFLGHSSVYEFYRALGQFNYYALAMEDFEPDRVLFLAVPVDIYDTFFSEPLTIKAMERYHLKVLVYNIELEIITKWIN